jgi:iron-sulfur cluster repair protein YtfE (RIC family)
MSTLTAPMQRHHKHCDDLFADAEAAIVARDWAGAASLMTEFHSGLECHFRTEEEILFPAFEAATGMTLGPTQMMRLEHAQMRELADRMEEALRQRDAESFGGAAGTLLIMMQQHNMKEENILYPMCDRSLAGQAGPLGAQLDARLATTCLATQ